MDKEICLDTNICIELIKGNPALKSMLEPYHGMPTFLSSITVFELFLRKSNTLPIENFIMEFEIASIDEHIAKKASFLFKQARSIGKPADIRDILIAATCIINNFELVTLNKKDFMHIKELRLLNI